jgi:hypothetical protein
LNGPSCHFFSLTRAPDQPDRSGPALPLPLKAHHKLRQHHEAVAEGIGLGTSAIYMQQATAEGIGLGTSAMYMQRTRSGAAGNGLYTTAKYMRGAEDISLGTTIKYLRRATSAAANNGLSTTIKYLLNQTRARLTTRPRATYTKAGHAFC